MRSQTHCRPDIVLSDIRLPKRDGFELLQDIRALGAENGGNVPVIAMTAFGGSPFEIERSLIFSMIADDNHRPEYQRLE